MCKPNIEDSAFGCLKTVYTVLSQSVICVVCCSSKIWSHVTLFQPPQIFFLGQVEHTNTTFFSLQDQIGDSIRGYRPQKSWEQLCMNCVWVRIRFPRLEGFRFHMISLTTRLPKNCFSYCQNSFKARCFFLADGSLQQQFRMHTFGNTPRSVPVFRQVFHRIPGDVLESLRYGGYQRREVGIKLLLKYHRWLLVSNILYFP